MTGYESLMSIEMDTETIDDAKTFVNGLKLFKLGVPRRSQESLVSATTISYTKEINPERLAAMGMILGLVRLSISSESAEDLIRDLSQALSLL